MRSLRSIVIRILFRENRDCPWCDAGFPAYRRRGAFRYRWIHFTPHNGDILCSNGIIRNRAQWKEHKGLTPIQYIDALKVEKQIIDWKIEYWEHIKGDHNA